MFDKEKYMHDLAELQAIGEINRQLAIAVSIARPSRVARGTASIVLPIESRRIGEAFALTTVKEIR